MASDTIAVAATWALAKLGDKQAIPLLRKVAQSGTPDMRAFAVLGLGSLKDRTSTALLSSTARSLDAGTVARAAAAYALGELGADTEATTLVTLAEGTDALPREMAILALARMGMAKGDPPGGKAAIAAMADAVFSGDAESGRARQSTETLRQAAAGALVLLATKGAADARPDALPAPDESVDAESTLDQLVPRSLLAKDRAAALVAFAEPLKRAAQSALSTSTERARAVLDGLGGREGAFEPFLGNEDAVELASARVKAREIAAALEPSVIALSRHPDPSVRTKALVLLSRSKSDASAVAIASAVTDSSENVQRVALASIGQHADAKSVAAAAKIMRGHESWAMRVLAAQALGRLGAAGAGAEATRQLKEAATKESYALVREAALVALATYDKSEASQLAATIAQTDPEPRVRETATKIRAGK
jgi:HEAT repeat protein